MATLKDTSALNALNEKDYVNKLYDSNTDTTKKLLEQNYGDNTGLLNTEKQNVQQQTAENINRTNIEAAKMQDLYKPNVSSGASAQAALAQGNSVQKNTTALKQKQNDADTEIERQRQLLASQYSAAIKQAQANNDMERAQQLYNAAKEEEAQLLSMRQNAASLMAQRGDTSIRDSLLAGETPSADYSGQTWEQVLKNEQALNQIYDNQLGSQRLQLQMENEEAMSDLAAKQAQREAQTDADLNKAYVDAMKKAKNYAEVQTAYGQGSGTAAAARLAQDTELQKALTDLRGVQMGANASAGMERLDLAKAYRDQLAKQTADINSKRAAELFKAAEQEESTLLDIQKQIGQELAAKNDYSVLGKLYGLTPEQIDRLMGRGKYGYVPEDGSSYRSPAPEPVEPVYKDLINPTKTPWGTM